MMQLSKEIKEDFDTLIDQKEKYLLAFSGGPDSIYLLWMLSFYFGNELRNHILLCYINYHDSPFVEEEERIVDETISFFQIEAIKNDVYYSKEQDRNFEEWARDYRYDLFLKIVQERHLAGVLTAHQKTDVVETYFLQKERKNLPLHYGLKKKNDLYGLSILRPLLSISKEELTRQLDDNHIPYYFDITNTDLKKKRNYIRAHLKEEELDSTIEKINQENKELERIYSLFSSYKKGMPFSLYETLSEEQKRRFCFYLLDGNTKEKKREADGKRIYDFLKKKEYGLLVIEDEWICYRTKKGFFLEKEISHISYSFTYPEKGIYENEFFRIDLSSLSEFNLKNLPVEIRNYHQGDQVSTNLPTKDIYRLLRKQGVPAFLVPIYPVFVQEGKIICVPFYRDLKEKKIPFSLLFLDEYRFSL